MAFGKSSFRN